MTPEEIRGRFNTITVWQRGGERAPHKPLLALCAIARLLRGERRMIPYAEIDRELGRLLMEFGRTASPIIRTIHSGVCRTMVSGK
jgi:putative restriction endonuclease